MRQKTITANEMKAIDMNAAGLGMSPLQLMENAGAAVAEIAAERMTEMSLKMAASDDSPIVLFIAGLGNNGGDTFVAARHLACSDIPSAVFLLGRENQIKTNESQLNFKLLKQTKFVSVFEIKSESELMENYQTVCKNTAVIVDGIFGTGFSGKPKGLEKAAIDLINDEKEKKIDLFVLAVDIPSGMLPAAPNQITSTKNKTENNKESVINADAVITFHKMKTWLEGSDTENIGKIYVRPIGIPENAEKYIGPGDVALLYRRTADSKKGDSGKILVIAGGPYSGAPALAGTGALRAGCDIVTIAAPSSIYKPIASYAPEFIVRKLSGDVLSENDIPLLKELILSHDTVIIGPGLGRDPSSLKAAAQLIPVFKKAVIDADALRPEIFEALIQKQDRTQNQNKEQEQNPADENVEIIITPHYQELLRTAEYLEIVLPSKRKDAAADVLEAAIAEISRKIGVTVLLKGPEDLISNGTAEETRYNATGNAGMSVGGTGDVLAGIVGGLLAANSTAAAAGCGAYLCGKAGDAAYSEIGNSLLPSDILDKLPFVFSNKMPPEHKKDEKKRKTKKKQNTGKKNNRGKNRTKQ